MANFNFRPTWPSTPRATSTSVSTTATTASPNGRPTTGTSGASARATWRDGKGQHAVCQERATTDGTYREVTKTQSAGNPAYLGTVMKALEDIRKVWGAESPKQVQVEAEVQVVSPQEQLTRIGQHMRQPLPEVVAEVVGGDV